MDSPANPIPSGTGVSASLTTPPAPQRKSEAIAFLLSFFFPGAGAYYCGKKRAGLWTFGLTVLSVLILYLLARPKPQGTLLLVTGPLFRVSLVLCAFAIWDALATARAVNAGRGNVDRFNPRLAAMLNLATRGFGYFYLRERRLGLAAFLYSCLFAMAATHWNSILFTLLLEGSTIYFAVHSYWLARKKNPAVPRSWAIHARTVNAWDYACYGYTVLLAMMCVISLAVGFQIENFHLDQSTAVYEVADRTTTYVNPREGVKLRILGAWEKGEINATTFVQMKSSDPWMVLIFGAVPNLPLITTADRLGNEMEKELAREGGSKASDNQWIVKGEPLRKMEFCVPAPTMVGMLETGDACGHATHSTLWLWRKKDRWYTLIWITMATNDPRSIRGRANLLQYLPAAASVQ
jgi:hypothetical protein